MATKVIMSPSKYIQGPDELKSLPMYTKAYGSNPFIIADSFVTQLVGDILKKDFKQVAMTYHMELFGGECSNEEIERLCIISNQHHCDVIIGVGGGKVMDTAKAIAYYANLPLLIVPTIASTDAPCSALSVLYTPDGAFTEYLLLPINPNVVVVDTTLIAKSPTRLLVSGMGDALATFFEARACKRSNASTMAGAQSTATAYALAQLCYTNLMSDGLKAKLAADSGIANTSLEIIVETNTYLSGIGFESSGLAGAHAIHNGFNALAECNHLYHGEKVAFGTIVQLVLENAPLEEIKEVVDFCHSVGLPTTLEEMGIPNATQDQLMSVALLSTAPDETIHNMPFPVSADDVYAAILVADKLGSYFH